MVLAEGDSAQVPSFPSESAGDPLETHFRAGPVLSGNPLEKKIY